MGKVHERIDEALREWIERQHLFFVGTAAAALDATVNISPKGMADTFVVLDDRRCAYLDLTGSGIETVAHLRDNGRITLMWCAFGGPARIVRVHGTGVVRTPGDDDWDALLARFPAHPGSRAIVVVTADRVSDSCGYAVPLMSYEGDRDRLTKWAEGRSPEDLVEYRALKNSRSIDGLPGLPLGL
jgi:Pyridoxamine 5'-phosphate oxidase